MRAAGSRFLPAAFPSSDGAPSLDLVAGLAVEAGVGGRTQQAQLLEQTRSYGMRLVGPNCMDLLNTDLESFANPRRFARLARRIGRRTPIVAVKSGRTHAGSRAASGHTAALAPAPIVGPSGGRVSYRRQELSERAQGHAETVAAIRPLAIECSTQLRPIVHVADSNLDGPTMAFR
jgi:succinyl-CoA ligase-like protein